MSDAAAARDERRLGRAHARARGAAGHRVVVDRRPVRGARCPPASTPPAWPVCARTRPRRWAGHRPTRSRPPTRSATRRSTPPTTSCSGSSTTCTTSCSSCRCSTAWRPAGGDAGWRRSIVDRVPGRETFHGLGRAGARGARRPVARPPARRPCPARAGPARVGSARAPDPTALATWCGRDTPTLPLLAPALERLLEELPAAGDGLARSERQLLRAVGAGARTPLDAFLADAEQEDARYAGDTIVFTRLERLADRPAPARGRPARRTARADAGRRAGPGRRGRRRAPARPRPLAGRHAPLARRRLALGRGARDVVRG